MQPYNTQHQTPFLRGYFHFQWEIDGSPLIPYNPNIDEFLGGITVITYMRCNDVSMEHIFQAFSLGFSDYSIRLTMDQDDFVARFFGPEGNTRNHSFLAMDEDQPIGLILGGVRQFDGYKTMRCGTLCIAPAYRGQGISNKLLELHKQTAISADCQQLWLEVIKDNHRAVKLYEKQG